MRLGDAARAFRETSDAQHDLEDLARAFALVEAALDDLAAGASSSPTPRWKVRGDVTPARPTSFRSQRHALSWRLHGLRGGLVAARRICSELTRVLDGAARR